MLDAITSTRRALATAHELSVRAQTVASGYRLAACALALLLAAMALDLLFPLDGVFRGLFMIGLTCGIVYAARGLRRRRRAEALRLERAAMLLERRHPEVESALINAVQFSAELAKAPADPAAPLMRREIARAEREAARLPVQDAVDLAAVARARRPLLLLCAFCGLSLLLFPRAYRFEAPRFLLFWADYPPFTLTDFYVRPQGARVKVGGSVTLTVRLGGLTPDSVTLVTATRRERERTMPLYADENGVYTQTLENLTADTWYYVRAGTGRSARYQIRVDQAPEVKAIQATLRPPAYTQRPPATAPLGEEGLRGLYGTQVELDVEATRPLESGRLVLTYPDAPEETVALAPRRGQSGHVGGGFILRRGGRFRIDLTAEDGLTTRDAARGRLELLRDQKPLVYLTVPGRNAIITPTMTVPLRAEAEDDVGLQRIELHRIVNDMADSAQVFAVPPGQRRAEAVARLDFKDLGARPGDVIQYYATAYDTDPGQPNLTDSERYWLWVVSEADYRRILAQQRGLPQLAQDYRALTDALKTLAERQRALAQAMERLPASSDPSLRKGGPGESSLNDPAWKPQRQALQKAQSELRREAQALAQEMKDRAGQKAQYDMEKGLQQRLSELSRQVAQAANGAMRRAEAAPSPSAMAQQGESAARQLERASGQGQQSVERALQALEKTAPLYQDVARLKRLAEQQAEMAMQARQLAQQVKQDAFAQARLKALAERQAQARQELRHIQQDLDQHAQECESVAPGAAAQARQLAAALAAMGVGERMEAAERAFRKQDSPGGAQEAERARRALERLFQKGRQCQAQAKQGLDTQAGLSLGQGAGNTLEQLARNMGPGMTPGQQGGGVQGQGRQPAPQPGSRPGDGGMQGGLSQQAMALTLQQRSQGRSSRRESRRHFPGADLPGEIGQQDIERLTDPSRKPSAVTDPSTGRYPAEYRRLVKDYFKAVAGGK